MVFSVREASATTRLVVRGVEMAVYALHRGIETFQVDCQIGALRCHDSALLCKSHNYLSYYNKSLRCFQEKAQQLLAMQKNTAIFQCEA